jgi:hypothetical protein
MTADGWSGGGSIARPNSIVGDAPAIGRALANESGPSVYEAARPDGFLFV